MSAAADTPIHIASDELAAAISPLGAELIRLTDASGQELLWDGDPAWWNGQAPILFPIVGTLRNDQFRHDGQVYSLPRHGFARRRLFNCIDHGATRATFRLESDAATLAIWPFAFRLDMHFAIEGTVLTLTASVTNSGYQPMPASFGYHPALRWPLPGAGDRSAHVIRFDQTEQAPARRLDRAGLLTDTTHPSPIQDRELALDDMLFVDDALIFDSLASRALHYGVPGERMIGICYPALPHLAFWSKPGAGYLCIEPWQGHSDPADFEGDIFAKPGMVRIAPGETRDFAMAIDIAEERD